MRLVEIGRSDRDGVSEFAFHVIVDREAEAAMELQACVGRFPSGVGGKRLAVLASAPHSFAAPTSILPVFHHWLP
jgi:hypothetical protein